MSRIISIGDPGYKFYSIVLSDESSNIMVNKAEKLMDGGIGTLDF